MNRQDAAIIRLSVMHYCLRLATGLAIVLVAGVVSGQTPTTTGFQIRIPPQIAPETVSINVAVFHKTGGMTLSEVRTRAGINDYPLPIANAASVKVLVYIAGYRTVAREFRDAELGSTTFVPPLAKLPTSRLNGRLVDSSNQPVANQTLDLSYSLSEAMTYFGYIDGTVPSLQVGRTRTDTTGAFTFDVPSLGDDPFFQEYSKDSDEGFLLDSTGRPVGMVGGDDTLRPSRFSAQRTYEKPLVVVQTQRGTLNGQLGREFLRQNGLPGDLTPYLQSVDSRPIRIELVAASADRHWSYNAMLKADGTFEVQLPPGTYHLNL